MTDREHDLEKPTTCRDFCEQIFDFQADELTEADRRAFEAHRDACAPCARRLEVEEGLLGALRERLRPEPAPPGLKERVQEALRAEEPVPARGGWGRQMVWALPVAASLLIALMLAPMLGDRIEGDPAGVVPFDARVTLVDLDCARAGKTIDQQVACLHPMHLNALQAANGRYLHLSLDGPEARRLVVDREMRGHLLHLRGDLYEEIDTVRIRELEDLGRPSRVALMLPAR